MIHDVDDTLKELLLQKVPLDPAAIDIRFEMPNKEWAVGVSRPTVNLYLYDVRENHELRSAERSVVRNGASAVLARAPVRIDLAYLVTVWTSDIADEHQLLGRLLATLLRFPLLPPEVLKGSVQTQPQPPQAWIAQPERMPSPWEFWGHMDHGMKAGLNVVLTTSLDTQATETFPLATQTVTHLSEMR